MISSKLNLLDANMHLWNTLCIFVIHSYMWSLEVSSNVKMLCHMNKTPRCKIKHGDLINDLLGKNLVS
jgi:hypothetical protein